MKLLSILMVVLCLSACASGTLTYSDYQTFGKLAVDVFDSQRNLYLERMNREHIIFRDNEFKNGL